MLVEHHALGQEPGEGLVQGDVAEVVKRAGEEPRVDEVQTSVLDAADVLVDRRPLGGALVEDRGLEPRAREAQLVPARLHERVHGVGVASSGASTGSWSAGTGTMPHAVQWITGIGVPQ